MCACCTPKYVNTNRWRNLYRWVGIAATVFNWFTLVFVHALLEGKEVQGLDGPRCTFTFEMNSFRLKWIAQFVNQVFQARTFVWVGGKGGEGGGEICIDNASTELPPFKRARGGGWLARGGRDFRVGEGR